MQYSNDMPLLCTVQIISISCELLHSDGAKSTAAEAFKFCVLTRYITLKLIQLTQTKLVVTESGEFKPLTRNGHQIFLVIVTINNH